MTEQPQQPNNPNLDPPMKSAAPPNSTFSGSKFSGSTPGKSGDRRSVSTSNPKIDPRISDTLQSVLAWIIRTTIQLRPTALATLRLVTTQANRWIQQLETQERTARDRNEPVVQPIDWTPVTQSTARIWVTIQPIWQKTIAIVKPRLPESFQPLSDRALSGIFAGTLLLVLWFSSALPSGQAATPQRNSQPPLDRSAYSNESSRDRNRSLKSSADRPSEAPVYTASDRPKRSYDSTPLPIADRSSIDPTASTNQLTPQPAIAEPKIQNPEIQNPEASRRLKLRQNLDIIADSLVDQAIVGIRPSGRSLTITLSDAWYRSSEDTQTKLTNSLLVTTQSQGYSNLRLEDTEGNLIARNPVVGEGMIILQRAR